ncbi:MAG: chorismate mutase family protein [Thermoplasmataceae archaeon]
MKEIENTRIEILKLTKQILIYYRERLLLAKKIAMNKNLLGIPIHDRKRELNVLRALGKLSEDEISFMNLLFELTILSEEKIFSNATELGFNGNYFKINGDLKVLESLSAIIACRAGDEVYCTDSSYEIFARTASARGSHLINERPETHDYYIKFGEKRGNADINVSSEGFMEVSQGILTRRPGFAAIIVEGR